MWESTYTNHAGFVIWDATLNFEYIKYEIVDEIPF
jgi:hypothetical protein